MQRTRVIPVLLSLVLLSVLCGALASASSATSPSLVISAVYGGGGNTGATFSNDYVELFNRGSSAVDVGTWSVQYATSAGTSWQATTLGGTIAPGHHYLVQLGTTGTIGGTLPLPDAVGSTNLAATGGKVALVHALDPITCGATVGSCSALAQDLVGYGSATDFETAAAPALSATTAAVRAAGGCTDTDSNAADFTAAAPDPRNNASAAATCSGTTTPAAPTQQASVDLDIQPVLSLSLERASLGFGQVATGSTPAPLSERVTVFSNRTTGYALSVHRSAFAPADLPLGLASAAPAGGQLSAALTGGGLAGIPVAPAADLVLGTTAAASASAGDVWPATVGFTGALPAVPPGHYTATLTFTVIGR